MVKCYATAAKPIHWITNTASISTEIEKALKAYMEKQTDFYTLQSDRADDANNSSGTSSS